MALLVNVDRLVLTGNEPHTCVVFKAYLNQCFHIKDLVSLKYFLRIEVTKSPKGLVLNQYRYALEIIDERGLLGFKSVDLPMEIN